MQTTLKIEKLNNGSNIVNINNNSYHIYLHRLLKNYPYKEDLIIKENNIIIEKDILNEFLENWKERI